MEKVQHLVDVDENMFAAFAIDSDGCISEAYTVPN
jgi:hypothetical protein